MKVCVIGNSHVGAIKLAWDNISKEYPEQHFTFFACGGSGMKDMVVSNGRFIASNNRLKRRLEYTSGGISEIIPENYDAFLIYGMGLALTPFGDIPFYSEAVKEAARRDRVERSLNFSIFKSLEGIANNPIFVGHNPFPSQTLSKGKKVDIAKVRDEVTWCTSFFGTHATFVSQPEITIFDGLYTKAEYSKGSRKLETGDKDDNEFHSEEDHVHMNVDYGKLWVRNFLDNYI